MKDIKLEIVYRDPKELIPDPDNARTHSTEQIDELCDLITEFGFTDPVDLDGSDMSLAGAGRTLAAIKLGLTEIPTISLAHLSERQKKAYSLAHNKIALKAGWDMDKLAKSMDDLLQMDFDVTKLGWNEQELDALLKQDPGILPDENEEPGGPNKETKSRAKSKILHKCPKCGEEFTA